MTDHKPTTALWLPRLVVFGGLLLWVVLTIGLPQ